MVEINKIKIPIYELNKDGSMKPNYIFHRSWDKVHSRCIEYPFAASRISGQESRILDIGISKASEIWIKYLDSLPINEVHGTDYDPLTFKPKKLIFTKADVRYLPYKDNYFDLITAVSVIEHIGLDNPQVNSEYIPKADENGDLNAIKEIARVLNKDGKLIITIPFGKKEMLILGNSTRCYNLERIKLFEQYLEPDIFEYYEYSPLLYKTIHKTILKKIISKIRCIFCQILRIPIDVSGRATWKKQKSFQSISKNIMHKWHTEAILCCVYKKK